MKTIGLLAPTGTTSGGVFQYTQSMIDALLLNGDLRVVLFTSENSRLAESVRDVRTLNRWTMTFGQKASAALYACSRLRSRALVDERHRTLFSDIDVFVSPAIVLYPQFFLTRPFVITLHDLQERYFPNFFSRRERVTRRLVNTAAARAATRIICESNCVKSDIVTFLGAPAHKIDVIPAPPPKSFRGAGDARPSVTAVKEKFDLGDRYLFYPAQFWPHKNHLNLLRAFAELSPKYPGLQLVLVGHEANHFAEVKREIARLEIDMRVRILGYVDYSDLARLYCGAEMLVMPTLFESISIPIYEAFSMRIPVCCSRVVALPEQVGDAGLLFDPMDPGDIATTIMKVLDDPALGRELAERGYQRMIAFDHTKYARCLSQAIEMAISSVGPGGFPA